MIEERIDGDLGAVHQIHHALGNTALLQQFEGVFHGQGHALRRLYDKRVAAGDRVRQEPERNHAREIEWDDGGNHAQRLADHNLVDSAGHVFEVVALHHGRDTAGNLNVFDGAAHFALGFSEGLAIFLSKDAGDVVEVIFEQHLQLEQRLNAVLSGRAAPLRISGSSRFDGARHFGGARHRDAPEYFGGCRIDDVVPLGGLRVNPLSVDEMRNFGGGWCGYGRHGNAAFRNCTEFNRAELHSAWTGEGARPHTNLGDVGERGFEHVQTFVHLGVGQNQRHQQPDHVAIGPGGDRHQAMLVTVL